MEYDKDRIYTALTADEIKRGSKGYYADCLEDLEERVRSDNKACYGEVMRINPTSFTYRFKLSESDFALFYLVEEKKFRPFRDMDEMIEGYNKHFNLLPAKHSPPAMWIKHKNTHRVYLITRIAEDSVTVCFERSTFTLNLALLANEYTWYDGAFCGVEGNDNY